MYVHWAYLYFGAWDGLPGDRREQLDEECFCHGEREPFVLFLSHQLFVVPVELPDFVGGLRHRGANCVRLGLHVVGNEVGGALKGDLPVGPGGVVGQVARKTNQEYSQLGLLGMGLNLTMDVLLRTYMSAALRAGIF